MALLVLFAGIGAACVEPAPGVPPNAAVADASNIDAASVRDAGVAPRPSLETEPFFAQRGRSGLVGQWWFYGEDPKTSFASESDDFPLEFELATPNYSQRSGAIDLDGGNEVIAQNPSSLFGPISSNSEFTLEAWLRFDRNDTSNVVSAPIDESSFVFNLYNDSGDARIEFVDGQAVEANAVFQSGRLVHIVVTYRNNLLSIYADGTLQDAKYVSTPGRWEEAAAINIGGALFERGAYDGEFFMLALWSRALSEGEVFQHFLFGRSPDDERVVDMLEPAVGLIVHGNVPAAPQQLSSDRDKSIESDATIEPNEGRLRLSSSKRMLLRYPDVVGPRDDEREVAADFVSVTLTDGVASEIPFAVAALWRPWSEAVADWNYWGEADEWAEPGASGQADRSEPFNQFFPFEARRYVVQLPGELVDYWGTAPAENGGVIFYYPEDRSVGERQFFSSNSNRSARRPYLARLVRGGTLPDGVLEAPIALRRDNPSGQRDTSLRWAPVPGADFYDVFADDDFIGRSLEPGFVHRDGSRQMTQVEYRVLARDFYGRVSDWSDIYVIFEGL